MFYEPWNLTLTRSNALAFASNGHRRGQGSTEGWSMWDSVDCVAEWWDGVISLSLQFFPL